MRDLFNLGLVVALTVIVGNIAVALVNRYLGGA
jgi:hypothetical protein